MYTPWLKLQYKKKKNYLGTMLNCIGIETVVKYEDKVYADCKKKNVKLTFGMFVLRWSSMRKRKTEGVYIWDKIYKGDQWEKSKH